MANVSAGTAYATNLIAVQRFFYGQEWGWGYQFLLSAPTHSRLVTLMSGTG